MAKIYETGHAKNVARFSEVIGFCKGYQNNYNPSKATIQIPQLEIVLDESKNAIADVTNSAVAFSNATNHRQNTFTPLKKLSTKLINALAVTEAADNTIDDAKSINKKIQGTKATKKTTTTNTNTEDDAVPTDEKSVSNSQRSYDQQVEHFAKMIALLKTESSYNPNEAELQINTLEEQLNSMRTANNNVTNAYINLSNSRLKRNEILYKKDSGLCDIAQEVKKYVKSVFGATSPQYKQISSIRFSIK